MIILSEILVRLEGAQEIIVDKLTEIGIFKTKSETIRAGILELGKEYQIFKNIKDIERELVAKKLKKEETKMKRKGIKYLSKEKALLKYR